MTFNFTFLIECSGYKSFQKITFSVNPLHPTLYDTVLNNLLEFYDHFIISCINYIYFYHRNHSRD